ncbi:MAG: bifunctional oligoribonuclease/PAP phosphatase NrnA [Armatimonadetes bacterium]|nr:bifunctional oligoribonuclease/PAP phosphatase NrnA [Armatimonadota bacterium]
MRVPYRLATDAILSADSVVLAGHENADGDSLGCVLALTLAIRALGKRAVPLSTDGVPEIYRWMPGQEDIRPTTDERGFDLAIVCDTSAYARLGAAAEPMRSARVSMRLDHHGDQGDPFDIACVNSKAAATGEMAYQLIRRLGVPITRDMAECLLCAIVTDTGSFRFMNTSPSTLQVSADLMRRGACPAYISELVFESRSPASVRLLARALSSLQFAHEQQVAWVRLTAADFAETGADDADSEGVVNHARSMRGVRVGMLFREAGERGVRVSLRSRDGVDVAAVARRFGGGGHVMAAGCTVHMGLAAAEAAVLAAVEAQLSR